MPPQSQQEQNHLGIPPPSGPPGTSGVPTSCSQPKPNANSQPLTAIPPPSSPPPSYESVMDNNTSTRKPMGHKTAAKEQGDAALEASSDLFDFDEESWPDGPNEGLRGKTPLPPHLAKRYYKYY
ncbi:hypothetical protein PENSPDRAFT_659535 [Peniophora sp. CONT]|nr:hypothetical protein PENSPDRAFT_659535 [Peniophora sp. CONT]